MKAVRVVRNGRPTEVIEVLDVDVPDPEPGGVRIAVSAASVNFGDIARTRGGVASVMAQPPFTLGMDVCGVVDAAGDGAEDVDRPAGGRNDESVARWYGRACARGRERRCSTHHPSSTTSRRPRSPCRSTSVISP